MVLIERGSGIGKERVFIRSNAALRIAAHLGGWWRLLLVFGLMPRVVRDCFYDAFARYRYRLFGKYDRCLVPAADGRSRFLDSA